MSIDEMIEVLQGFKDGKDIQVELTPVNGGAWATVNNPNWNFFDNKYRIKPQPEYVPFDEKDFELFCDRWVMCKKGNSIKYKPIYCDNQLIGFSAFERTYKGCFEDYVFIDGTPFGKLKQ